MASAGDCPNHLNRVTRYNIAIKAASKARPQLSEPEFFRSVDPQGRANSLATECLEFRPLGEQRLGRWTFGPIFQTRSRERFDFHVPRLAQELPPARRDGLRETCARKRLHSQAARNNATRTKRAVAASTTRLSGWRESMASNCGASNECQSEELDNSPRD